MPAIFRKEGAIKFKKRPILIEASQWFHNGDHPEDESSPIESPDGTHRLSEGKVVRFYKSLNIPGDRACAACGNPMKIHGELPYLRSGEYEIVCPGDYIITSPQGRYKMPAKEFEAMYEPYPEMADANTSPFRIPEGGS